MKHFTAVLLLLAGVLCTSAKMVPDRLEFDCWFYGPGGNYGVQQWSSLGDPDDAWTVFAFADHFWRLPFRFTHVFVCLIIGVLGISFLLYVCRQRSSLSRRKVGR
ncbi:MAG: hypothetical protein AB1813_19720 [Verrucomicrobiota bacterium]